MIHLFVEILDRYFGNVCELDIIFNFHKVGCAQFPPTFFVDRVLSFNLFTIPRFS